jgi:hypothetical protein
MEGLIKRRITTKRFLQPLNLKNELCKKGRALYIQMVAFEETWRRQLVYSRISG